MRHIYIRGSLGLIWLVAAIVCGVSGNFPMMGALSGIGRCIPVLRICDMEKEKDGKGGR